MRTAIYAILVICAVIGAVQAMRVRRLLTAALWLAGSSAMLSILFYLMGAHEVAVIELSVGAGLVTVLFVFAISITGKEIPDDRRLLPKPFAWVLVIAAGILIGWLILPLVRTPDVSVQPTFANMLWQQRGLDVLAQVALIFAGTLGVLGLLAPDRKSGVRPSAEQEMPS